MNTTTPIRFVRPPSERRNRREHRDPNESLAQLIVAGLVGFSIFLLAIISLSIGYRINYSGRIFPGVSIAGVDVSGMAPVDAAVKIRTALSFPYSGKVLFRDGANLWVETPSNLGMSLDPDATAKIAYDFGRSSGIFTSMNDQLNAAQVGAVVPPVIQFDQRVAYAYLQNLAKQVERPVVEASLVINGLDVSAQSGQPGRQLDIESTLAYLHAQMRLFRDGEVTLFMTETAPQVLDANPQAEAARRLLSAPFTINLPDARTGDPGPWQITPAELAPMLRVGREGIGPGSRYVLQLDHDMLKARLDEIAKQVNRPEEDARFTFNQQTGQITPTQASKIGLRVDSLDAMKAIQKAIGAGEQTVQLAVKATQPLVEDTATSERLGIRELIGSQTTYFFGSSAARRKNIQTAAARYNGLLVAPGATFSMGEHMGDVSLDSGFAEALIIYNGKTIKGVGGGVCQVSTTLFRTVFYAGLEIVERHAHAYRVYYYEQAPGGSNNPQLSGFDATVYFPLVDFKFKNDTPFWILMETSFDDAGSSLTWNLYSTPDGRTVQATFSGPTNVTPPLAPTITFNPDAEPGSVAHVDYAAEGADINIHRTVTRNGEVLFSHDIVTRYQPWADACEYGPDVKDPEKIFKKRGWCQKP